MSLYGHEISEDINVFEAGLTRWLKLDKGDFCRHATPCCVIQAAGGPKRKIIGLEMAERGSTRDGYSGAVFGRATTLAQSPPARRRRS